MKLSVGLNPEKPLLQAHIPRKTINVLLKRPGFAELRDSFSPLGDNKDIRLSQTDDYETYSLLAKRIGVRPQIVHEQHLRPFVRLLEWGTIAVGKKPICPVQLIGIDAQKSLDSHLHVESQVYWPQADDKQVIEIATTAMQRFGKQVRLGRYSQPQKYDHEVGVAYIHEFNSQTADGQESDDENYRNVDIFTFDSKDSRPQSSFSDKGRYFELSGNRLTSYKEQLVHLVGAIAIGYADHIIQD